VWELALFGSLATATWGVLAAVLWVAASRRFRQLAGRTAVTAPERAAPAPAAVRRQVSDDKEPIDVHHQ
jgi:hypothetical protein